MCHRPNDIASEVRLRLKCYCKGTAEILRIKEKKEPSESLLERSNGIGMFRRKLVLQITIGETRRKQLMVINEQLYGNYMLEV